MFLEPHYMFNSKFVKPVSLVPFEGNLLRTLFYLPSLSFRPLLPLLFLLLSPPRSPPPSLSHLLRSLTGRNAKYVAALHQVEHVNLYSEPLRMRRVREREREREKRKRKERAEDRKREQRRERNNNNNPINSATEWTTQHI